MHLQVRIVAATLLLAALSIGTGTVLLLGYLLAAFSIGLIIFIMARKMIKRSLIRALRCDSCCDHPPTFPQSLPLRDRPIRCVCAGLHLWRRVCLQ